MYLAINYSPAAARLVRSGQIDIDYFKTPDWDWMVAEAGKLRPVAVHFTLDAGNGGLDQEDWDKLDQLLRATQTPYVNLHLDARQNYYPEYRTDTTRLTEIDAVTQVILGDVSHVIERFGHDRVILENSPYQGVEGNTMRLCVQPECISRVVAETGCGLLLDIAHAIVTAKYLGTDPGDYMSRLPVGQLKEMHFAGIHQNESSGHLMDHLSIQAEDWHWLDWVLNHIKSGEWSTPWLLAFEYGGVGEPFEWRSNPAVIAEQVPKLFDHIRLLES